MGKKVLLVFAALALPAFSCAGLPKPETTQPVQPQAQEPTLEELKAEADRLVAQLASESYGVREHAASSVKSLVKGSRNHRCELVEYLKEILGQSQDPEVRTCLEVCLDHYLRPWKYYRKLHVLKGHTDAIYSLSFSRDGRRIVSADRDGTIRIWDPYTGKCVRTLRPDKKDIDGAEFNPDGKLLVVTGDETVWIWKSDTGECFQTISLHTEWPIGINFTSDGRYLLLSGADNVVRILDPRTGKCVRKLTQHTARVIWVVLSPDGRRMATIGFDKTLIWNARTWEVDYILKGCKIPLRDLTFSSDSGLLATVGWEHTVKVWDLSTGECLRTLDKHSDFVSFSPDGKLLVTAFVDTARVYEASTGKCVRIFKGPRRGIWGATFSPDGKTLVIQCIGDPSSEDTVVFWDPRTGIILRTLETGPAPLLRFSPDGTMLAYQGDNNVIVLWGIPEEE